MNSSGPPSHGFRDLDWGPEVRYSHFFILRLPGIRPHPTPAQALQSCLCPPAILSLFCHDSYASIAILIFSLSIVRAIVLVIIVIITVVSAALVLNLSSLRAGTALGAAHAELVEGVGRYFEVRTGRVMDRGVEPCSRTLGLGRVRRGAGLDLGALGHRCRRC